MLAEKLFTYDYLSPFLAESHMQQLIEDVYNVTHDPQRGTIHGDMIRDLFISFKRQLMKRLSAYCSISYHAEFYTHALTNVLSERTSCDIL